MKVFEQYPAQHTGPLFAFKIIPGSLPKDGPQPTTTSSGFLFAARDWTGEGDQPEQAWDWFNFADYGERKWVTEKLAQMGLKMNTWYYLDMEDGEPQRG